MKRIFLLSLLSLVFIQLKAQQQVVFKFKYLPGHTYLSSMTMHNNITLNFKGPEEELEKMKAQGITNPMMIIGASSMNYTVKTGVFNKDKGFPITINYTNVVNKQLMGDKELPIPKNQIIGKDIYAHSDVNGELNIDSLSGSYNNKDSLINVISSILKNINKQIKFPEKPLKPGDTFTVDMPMNIPVFGKNMAVSISILYKLINIKNGIGYFDVNQSTSFTINTAQGPVGIKGTGTGKLQFSIKDSFPTHFESDINLNYTMVVQQFNIDGLAKISMVYDTKVN